MLAFTEREYMPSGVYLLTNSLKSSDTTKSGVICFWNYSLQKVGLLKSLKSPVWEHLWTVNIWKGPKYC